MAKRKKRRHRVVVTVVFDKACTRRVALREAKDNIHGDHYCSQFDDSDPGQFIVRGVRLHQERRNA